MKQSPPPSSQTETPETTGDGSGASFDRQGEPLGKMLRSLLGQPPHILHPRVLERVARNGHLSTNVDFIGERPCSTASLSHVVGADAVAIGLLYDIDLANRLSEVHHDQGEREVAARLLSEARALRRAFNRLGQDNPRLLSTKAVARLLGETEQHILRIDMPREHRQILCRAFDECAHHLQLAGPQLTWEVARESIAFVLGELREVAVGTRLNSCERTPPTLSPDALIRLRTYVGYLHEQAAECARAVPTSGASPAAGLRLTNAVRRLHSEGREEIEASYSRTDVCSVPVKLVAASRRSLCGTRLGMVNALSELAKNYEEAPSKANLKRIVDMLHSWKVGELPSEIVSGGKGQETLNKHPFSIAGTSEQSFFRDTVLPLLSWCAEQFDELPTEMHTLHLANLIRGTVAVLDALTVRDMATTLDAIRYDRDTWASNPTAKWQIPMVFPGAQIARVLLGRPLLSRGESSPLIDRYYEPPGLLGQTIHTISQHFQAAPSRVTSKELRFIAEAGSWARRCAKRYQKQIPPLPSTEALWITEYDGGAGTTLPHSIQDEFEQMQHEVRIPRGSRRSGLIVPENAEWLREHIYEHDGFLITTNEGNVLESEQRQKPSALFLATCSQSGPSPLMQEISRKASAYIEALPRAAVGKNPQVLCELAISTDEARFYRRAFGEHAYQVLWEQAVFNLVARFPTAERIECFATCLEGTDAMKAHARFGWKETGAVYQDQFGNTANIIHTTIYPAAIILGYRDITS